MNEITAWLPVMIITDPSEDFEIEAIPTYQPVEIGSRPVAHLVQAETVVDCPHPGGVGPGCQCVPLHFSKPEPVEETFPGVIMAKTQHPREKLWLEPGGIIFSPKFTIEELVFNPECYDCLETAKSISMVTDLGPYVLNPTCEDHEGAIVYTLETLSEKLNIPVVFRSTGQFADQALRDSMDEIVQNAEFAIAQDSLVKNIKNPHFNREWANRISREEDVEYFQMTVALFSNFPEEVLMENYSYIKTIVDEANPVLIEELRHVAYSTNNATLLKFIKLFY